MHQGPDSGEGQLQFYSNRCTSKRRIDLKKKRGGKITAGPGSARGGYGPILWNGKRGKGDFWTIPRV